MSCIYHIPAECFHADASVLADELFACIDFGIERSPLESEAVLGIHMMNQHRDMRILVPQERESWDGLQETGLRNTQRPFHMCFSHSPKRQSSANIWTTQKLSLVRSLHVQQAWSVHAYV